MLNRTPRPQSALTTTSPLLRRRLIAASVAVAMVGAPALLLTPAAIAAPQTAASPEAVEAVPEATAPEATAPLESAPADAYGPETPVEEPVTGEDPAGPTAPEETPVEEPTTGETPAEEPTTGEAPAEEPTTGETPAEEPTTGETPVETPEAVPGTLTLVSPTDGATVDPATALFAGTGVTALDIIEITYEDADGDTAKATSDALPVLVGADLTWTAPVSFGEFAEDQTDVEVTVVERDLEGAMVGSPITVSISVVSTIVPAYPYVVALPAEGSTVDTYTPTLSGTAGPGEAIVVTVTNPDDTLPLIVGGALADANGAFTLVLDLGKVVQDDDGETEITIDVTRVGADGTLLTDNLRSVDVTFAPGGEPFEPNEPGILLVPERITVSDATNPLKGVQISATGFQQAEDVQVTLTAPSGATVVFDEEALELLGGADETGTFEAPLFLFAQPELGEYTVTVTGVDSDVSVSGTFELIADPAPVTPPTPTVPADNGTVTPIDNTPTDDGSTDDGWADDELAYTGADSAPLAGLAAALLLAGAALVLFRRKGARALAI